MRCSLVRSLLDDHLDGLLPSAQSNEIRTHLDSCAECDGDAELARCVTAPLSEWGDLEPPAGCFDRILSRIDALPAEAHVPAPPPSAFETPSLSALASLRSLRGGARWFMTSGAAAAAVLLAATAIERTGDIENPTRTRDRAARVQPAFASLQLKPGEIPLVRTRIYVSDDMEENDGLRRTPGGRVFPSGPAGNLAVPVSQDPFGASPR